MAPNLITLAGLSLNFVTMGVFLANDTAYKETFPFWAYALMAFTVLGYQTLDAVDGKQARRTNTSSPLGQLFDHGCDAMSTSIVFSFMYQGLLLGRESDLSGWLLIYIPTHVSQRFGSGFKLNYQPFTDHILLGPMGGAAHRNHANQLYGSFWHN